MKAKERGKHTRAQLDSRALDQGYRAMHLRHFLYFVKIVEAGSFSRAASIVHVAQPALSQQIAELEDKLGVTLLHRSARGATPTMAGEKLYEEAVSILRQMERLPDIIRSSEGQAQGVVRLGISSALAPLLVGALMNKCRSDLPRVNLCFSLAGSALLQNWVHNQTLDLALVFEDEPALGVARRLLFQQKLFWIRSREPGPSVSSVTLAQIARLPLILPIRPNPTRTVLDRLFLQEGIEPCLVAEADVISGMLCAVQAGVAHAVLPKGDFYDTYGCDTLEAIPIDPPIYLAVSVLSPVSPPLTVSAQAVSDLLCEFISSLRQDNPPPGAAFIDE